MKFNKELNRFMTKYCKNVPLNGWFDYKIIKKKLKIIVQTYNSVIETLKSYNNDEEECCICLDNKNVMKTFCCSQPIHHTCYIAALVYTSQSCPLCRQPSFGYFQHKDMIKENIQKLNIEILSLISCIHLNIIKVENICESHIIRNHNIRLKYCSINYNAVIKICKKILRYFYVDVKDYFLKFMHKKNILKPYYHKDNLFITLLKSYKQKLMMHN